MNTNGLTTIPALLTGKKYSLISSCRDVPNRHKEQAMYAIHADDIMKPALDQRRAKESGRRCRICRSLLSPYNLSPECYRTHSEEEIRCAKLRLIANELKYAKSVGRQIIDRLPTPAEFLEIVCIEGKVGLKQLYEAQFRGGTTSVRSIAAYLLSTDFNLLPYDAAQVLKIQRTENVDLARRRVERKLEEWEPRILGLIARIRSHYRTEHLL